MRPLDPDAPLPGLDGATVLDFWTWAYSALHENTVRPVLAEYIVGALLRSDRGLRQPWAPFDLTFEGRGIEVKSSAFVQATLKALAPMTGHTDLQRAVREALR